MVQLEAWLTGHCDLNDGIAEAELVANANVILREVRGGDVFTKGADDKLVLTIRQLGPPAIVVARVILVDGIVGRLVRRVLTLIAGKAQLGQADPIVSRLLVDGRGDLDTSERFDFSCSQT